jgi:predicted nucleotidyltransferase
MDKERILGILRQHEAEIKAAGILHLRLFGSVARGEATPQSDVDLLIDVEGPDFNDLLRVYGSEDEIAGMLGFKTHFTSEQYLRPEYRDSILGEAVDVF